MAENSDVNISQKGYDILLSLQSKEARKAIEESKASGVAQSEIRDHYLAHYWEKPKEDNAAEAIHYYTCKEILEKQSPPKAKIELESQPGIKIEYTEIKKFMSPSKDLTFAGFEIDKSTIDEILKKIDSGISHRTGDASTALNSVCYTLKDGSTIRFESGEMGGGKYLTGVRLKSNDIDLQYCVSSPKITEASNKRGIKLGMTITEVKKALGKPSYNYKDSEIGYYYDLTHKHPNDFKCSESSEVGHYIFIIKDNRVVELVFIRL